MPLNKETKPNQLVQEIHSNSSSVINNLLPPLEMSDTFIKYLNALHAARKTNTKAESLDTIKKKAICYQVRISGEQFLQAGDHVFYERDDSY